MTKFDKLSGSQGKQALQDVKSEQAEMLVAAAVLKSLLVKTAWVSQPDVPQYSLCCCSCIESVAGSLRDAAHKQKDCKSKAVTHRAKTGRTYHPVAAAAATSLQA